MDRQSGNAAAGFRKQAPARRALVMGGLALALAIPYAPTLLTPFDFNDDSVQVYSAGTTGLGSFLDEVGRCTLKDFRLRGPFRPVYMLLRCTTAELFGDNALPHRVVRMAWMLTTAMLFLWLLAELGITGWAAWITSAVAFWAPFRNEYWIGLGMTEAFGTPFGFLALILAARGARSSRPWVDDAGGWLCVLAACGCKNTFAAVVPAQILLRLTAGGCQPLAGWRRHWPAALFLASVLVFPAAHLLILKIDPGMREYRLAGMSWYGLSLWPQALLAGFGFDYLAASLALFAAAHGLRYLSTRGGKPDSKAATSARLAGAPAAGPIVWAGLALIMAGVGIYLPTAPGVSGRYTAPAVWGCDLLLALFFSKSLSLPAGRLKFAATLALCAGLVAMLTANIGKQTKCQGRAHLFWQVVRVVEDEVPAGSTLAWLGQKLPRGDEFSLGEGFHFRVHLIKRGRSSLKIAPMDIEHRAAAIDADFACTSSPAPPSKHFRLMHTFESSYWLGLRSCRCYLWKAVPVR